MGRRRAGVRKGRQAPEPKRRQKKQQNKAPAAPRARAARVAEQGYAARGFDARQDTMAEVLTHDDALVLSYLDVLANPDASVCRVPVVLGQFELETNLYRAEYTGTATAGANGLAYVIVGVDNWLESGNAEGTPQNQFVSYTGGASGTPIWASTLAQNAAATPAVGVAAVGAPQDSVVLDGGHTGLTRLRQVSATLEVWGDAALQTAAGDIIIAAVRNSEALNESPLNGINASTIAAYPQDYVVHSMLPLSNWDSDMRMLAHLVPWTEECFIFDSLPVAGSVVAPYAALAAVGQGMVSGQSFRYRVVVTYETNKPKSYLQDVETNNTHYVDTSRIANALRPLHQVNATSGPKGHGANKGAAAFAAAHPGKVPALASPKLQSPSFVENLTQSAGKGLSWLAGKIPYVGGIASSAVDWLFS